MKAANINGLEVGLAEFKKMKPADRDVLIYKNVVMNRQSKLSQYITFIWLFILTVATGFKKYFP